MTSLVNMINSKATSLVNMINSKATSLVNMINSKAVTKNGYGYGDCESSNAVILIEAQTAQVLVLIQTTMLAMWICHWDNPHNG